MRIAMDGRRRSSATGVSVRLTCHSDLGLEECVAFAGLLQSCGDEAVPGDCVAAPFCHEEPRVAIWKSVAHLAGVCEAADTALEAAA